MDNNTKNCHLIFIKKWFFTFMCKADHLDRGCKLKDRMQKNEIFH